MGRGEKGVWHSGQDAALGMGIVAQQVKSMLGILDSWSRPLLQTAALFQFKYSPLSLTVRGKQMMTWVLECLLPMWETQCKFPGSWLQFGSALPPTGIWEVNPCIQDPLPPSLSVFHINQPLGKTKLFLGTTTHQSELPIPTSRYCAPWKGWGDGPSTLVSTTCLGRQSGSKLANRSSLCFSHTYLPISYKGLFN